MNYKTIIDVRTREEFMGGNVAGSINIPLNEVVDRIEEIRAMEQPILLCCLSGGRSGQATNYLKSQNIDCENGGGWMDVNYRINNL
ncbi:MAG TPA: rhodanese-like domain-containing protein [Taishania sp.]|nr:rhodanese-like domain-containing protein [Taishania sp.]HNS41115.1 rhodanese-like domain-containing protein [Taishania sp.]